MISLTGAAEGANRALTMSLQAAQYQEQLAQQQREEARAEEQRKLQAGSSQLEFAISNNMDTELGEEGSYLLNSWFNGKGTWSTRRSEDGSYMSLVQGDRVLDLRPGGEKGKPTIREWEGFGEGQERLLYWDESQDRMMPLVRGDGSYVLRTKGTPKDKGDGKTSAAGLRSWEDVLNAAADYEEGVLDPFPIEGGEAEEANIRRRLESGELSKEAAEQQKELLALADVWRNRQRSRNAWQAAQVAEIMLRGEVLPETEFFDLAERWRNARYESVGDYLYAGQLDGILKNEYASYPAEVQGRIQRLKARMWAPGSGVVYDPEKLKDPASPNQHLPWDPEKRAQLEAGVYEELFSTIQEGRSAMRSEAEARKANPNYDRDQAFGQLKANAAVESARYGTANYLSFKSRIAAENPQVYEQIRAFIKAHDLDPDQTWLTLFKGQGILQAPVKPDPRPERTSRGVITPPPQTGRTNPAE